MWLSKCLCQMKTVTQIFSPCLLCCCQVPLSSLCEWQTGETACRGLWLHLWPVSVEPLLRQEGPEGPSTEGILGRCCLLCLSPVFSWGPQEGCVAATNCPPCYVLNLYLFVYKCKSLFVFDWKIKKIILSVIYLYESSSTPSWSKLERVKSMRHL